MQLFQSAAGNEAHLKLLADMEKKEEAARCTKQELDKELAKSRGSSDACAPCHGRSGVSEMGSESLGR